MQNQSALSGATASATAATSAMLTAMPLCAMPRGRAGHGSAPRRATDASIWSLDWCRECAWVAETTGSGRPVARAAILLPTFALRLRSASPPAFGERAMLFCSGAIAWCLCATRSMPFVRASVRTGGSSHH